MYFLISTLLCLAYSFMQLNAMTDFQGLNPFEYAAIEQAAADFAYEIDVTTEQYDVLMAYLHAAQQTAECEYAFIGVHAAVRQNLAYVKNKQILSDEELNTFAYKVAVLRRLMEMKSDFALNLTEIEEFIDQNAAYVDCIYQLRAHLVRLLTQALEERQALIDTLLLEADMQLNADTLPIIGRFCRMLAQEPELMIDQNTPSLLRKVDIMHNLSQQIDEKLNDVTRIRDAMNQVVAFTLGVTGQFFKHCIAALDAQN